MQFDYTRMPGYEENYLISIFCFPILQGDRKTDILVIEETIRICRDRNVLREYLEKREKEVVNMMMTLFEEEQIMKAYTKSMIEEGREEGRKEGKAEGICILIEALKGLGQSRVFILSKLLSEYGLSEVEASKYL